MSDEERFLDEDVTGEEGQQEVGKPGIVPGFLLTVLKWAAIGLAAIILVATVSWATFSLFLKGRTPQGVNEFSPEYKAADLDLAFFGTMLDGIRGQTSDDPPKSFVVTVNLGYKKGDAKEQTRLIDKKELIQNYILKFFGEKTADELTTTNFNTLEQEVLQLLNNALLLKINKVLIRELQTF
ncbi:MAG TPA: flagellar basal body-associated FliL family protein [Spirochaetia bacterium]|nr:flagellar basal body-associated FliL family protein [Spirochaetia bacterium]